MTTYGFLGLGMMGAPMAVALADRASAEDGRLLVWNRTPGHDVDPIAHGAELVAIPAELLAAADVVVVMLPDLPQLAELTDGPAAILAGVSCRTVMVICSSVSPLGVRVYASHAGELTGGLLGVVDAPVSGGPEGARDASLAIMVGGSNDDVAAAWPALTAMGSTVRHLGRLGAGSIAKACNQIVGAATLIAAAEASILAEAAGLDVEAFWDLLTSGHAASPLLNAKRRNISDKDYSPAGQASYMTKDLGIVAEVARATGIQIAQADLSRELYIAIEAAGLGRQDVSVVHRLLLDRADWPIERR